MFHSDVVNYVGNREILEMTLPPLQQKHLNMEDDNNTYILKSFSSQHPDVKKKSIK